MHEDRRPSLSVTERGGTLLVHCFGGCGQAAVVGALRARGLWPGTDHGLPARPQSWLAPILTEERRRLARLAPFRLPWQLADQARLLRRAAHLVRGEVGDRDSERAWELEGVATWLNRQVDLREAAGDVVLHEAAASRRRAS